MKKLNPAEVADLLESRDGPCVTIYLTAGRQGLWAPRTLRRYRQLLDQAEQKLSRMKEKSIGSGVATPSSFLDGIRLYASLQTEVGEGFQAIVFFCSPQFSGYFPVPSQIELGHLHDRCSASNRFVLSPLADLINPTRAWTLIKLTKGGLNIYRGRGPALSADPNAILDWPDHPRAQALKAPRSTGQSPAKYLRFSSSDHALIDAFIRSNLSVDEARLPLILCGTKTDTEVCLRESEHTFDHVIAVTERYRESNADDLLNLAWPLLAAQFEQDWRMALAGLSKALKSGMSTCDPQQIARRLNDGILRLIAIEPARGLAAVPEELVQRAMALGCKVFLCQPDDLPTGSPVMAI
jgi:hypothetical protein